MGNRPNHTKREDVGKFSKGFFQNHFGCDIKFLSNNRHLEVFLARCIARIHEVTNFRLNQLACGVGYQNIIWLQIVVEKI